MESVRHSEKELAVLFFIPWGVWRKTSFAGLWTEARVPSLTLCPVMSELYRLQPTWRNFKGPSKDGPACQWSILVYCLGLNFQHSKVFFALQTLWQVERGPLPHLRVQETITDRLSHLIIRTSQWSSLCLLIRRLRFTEVKWLAQGQLGAGTGSNPYLPTSWWALSHSPVL